MYRNMCTVQHYIIIHDVVSGFLITGSKLAAVCWTCSSASDWPGTSGCTTTSRFDQASSWEPIGPCGQDGHSHGQNVSIHESMAKINEDKWRTGLCALLWCQSTRLHARSLHTKYGTEIKLHQHKGGVGCIVLSSKVWFHHLWYNINTIPIY